MRNIIIILFILFLVLSAVSTVVNAEVLNVPSEIHSQGEVAKPSSFTVNITVNPTVEHVPIDAVLVIDSSASMNRWSKVIAGGPNYYVTLATTGKGSYIGTFSLSSESSVELVLQTPKDIYNDSGTFVDQFKAYLVDNATGIRVTRPINSWRWSSDPAVVRWYNLSAGTYDIYARAKSKWATTTRIMLVELPPERINVAKSAAKYFVGLLKSYDRVAVINFSANATTLIDLTSASNKATINSTIDSITTDTWYPFPKRWGGKLYTYTYSATNISAGIEEAIKELDNYGRPGSVKVIILLTDGWHNEGFDPVYWASVAHSKGYLVYTIGIGGANESELRAIANAGGGEYYYATDETVLKQVYYDIYKEIVAYAYNVTLSLNFTNPKVKFDHAIPAPSSVVGNVAKWQWTTLKNNTSITVWVNSTVAGEQTVAIGNLTYYDYYGWHPENFTVIMNFTGAIPPLIVVAKPNKTTVKEGETLGITVTTTTPIANVTLTGNPPITPSNSIVNVIQVNNTTALIEWTPLYNYTDSNTTADLTIGATDVYGRNNSTTIYGLNVIDVTQVPTPTPTPTPTLTPTPTPTPTSEVISVKAEKGNMYIVKYTNRTNPPKDVGFVLTLNGNVINDTNTNFILTYFRENSTTWVLEIVPQYNFTNSLNGPVLLNVTFYNENHTVLNRTVVEINNTTAQFYPIILNAVELNKLTIRWIGDIGYPKTIFVGERIRIHGYLVNTTKGNVTVNNVNVSSISNQPTTVIFIPNAAGYYTVEINAVNVTTNNSTTLMMWKDVPIRIKPVRPS